ncbi:ATP-binding protein [Mycetocola lacteus]|uniref:ATP-binding protein n=2 Tax=Mycetocola lacteus TaxID=76637 RepID=A0A3L7AJS6_9MICO|nr:ATP-binding protein [Mycetocola lacteus]
MYYPFFRGKQFEFLAIRELAPVIARAGFTPIIEPVHESFTTLNRTLDELILHGATSTVIVNPRHGAYKDDGEDLAAELRDVFGDNDAVIPALLLTPTMSLERARALITQYEERPFTVIHAGFSDGKGLAEHLPDTDITHVFLDAQNTLYRRPFRGGRRVLISDGFIRKKNADYDEVDRFSDLHVTYSELGGDGYGDFLTVGDFFAQGGGPAYAVAIHLTYIDPSQDDQMFVAHFKSDSNDTPLDPAGKFSQALNKLVAKVDEPNSPVANTSAVREFQELHERGHFPGLGYVKKLSIKHHIETLAGFHGRV